MDIPNILYQYRNLDVFQKIIESKNLRLTSARHQNDVNELTFTINVLKKYIKKKANTQPTDRQDWLETIMNSFLNNDLDYDCFITCFSEEKDLLSQWCRYADDGRGLAIGFSFENTTTHNNLVIDKINYIQNEDEIFDMLKDRFAKIHLKFLERAVRVNKDYLSLLKIIRIALGIKQKGFQEEKEWRIAFILHKLSDIYNYDERHPYNVASIIKRTYSDDINGYPSGQWEGDPAINTGERYAEIGDFKFHTTRTKLVPYFEFKFEPKLLKEIVIGPNCQINEHDLKCLLECNGFKARDITISKSQLTYRSWI